MTMILMVALIIKLDFVVIFYRLGQYQLCEGWMDYPSLTDQLIFPFVGPERAMNIFELIFRPVSAQNKDGVN